MSRVYYHRTPGARFFMPDGKEICFAGGYFDSGSIKEEGLKKQVELELNRIADVAASQIYTKNPVIANEEKEVIRDIRSGAEHAFDGAHKITQPTETVPMPIPPQTKPILTPSADALAAAKAAVAKAEALKKG